MAICIFKFQQGCPGERQPRWGRGVERGRGWLSTTDRRGQPPSPPRHSGAEALCSLDLTLLGPASQAWSTAPLGQGCDPAGAPLPLQGFPSPPVPSSAPSLGVSPRPPLPHLSLSSLSLPALQWSYPLISPLLGVSVSAFFLPQDLFLVFPLLLFVICSTRNRNCPSLRIGKWQLCPTCSTPVVPAPAASLMLGGGWTTPGPVGCGGRAWLRTEATPSWIRPLPTVPDTL